MRSAYATTLLAEPQAKGKFFGDLRRVLGKVNTMDKLVVTSMPEWGVTTRQAQVCMGDIVLVIAPNVNVWLPLPDIIEELAF